MAKDQFNFEPRNQSGPDGTEETQFQNRDPVKNQLNAKGSSVKPNPRASK